jgi:hypothetical protein
MKERIVALPEATIERVGAIRSNGAILSPTMLTKFSSGNNVEFYWGQVKVGPRGQAQRKGLFPAVFDDYCTLVG